MERRFHQNPRYQNNVVTLGIDPNAPDRANVAGVQDFVEHVGATFPIGLEDVSTPTYNAFVANFKGLNPYPVDIVLDRNGVVRYIAREYDGRGLEQAVEEALLIP